ncbi:Hint domain-containing protein [Sulfitobacter mediterraneus]|uniref:Hint domain-containing protein n=1 Tax=Sulfitobacter mediterraneus TaxID=83219 RepID=UPI001939B522|nr:Hint domain-containing protein [Sulfitobacter mediterraneus]MBM1558795.1 Hint domain-containing protein [Sulfitobacter mediterraneus]MBM1570338.1 Hint domain-containing protein [Sulfitobacter mediterraneus]MBM1574151.1 Hint domain-containing protein [Sulfitobacter mediterraneus]MBM1577956.1 Hint domain-containing protein [Sulfitobacter mediterraneus]MBM1581753.1 Hint domain-containing protein [Sulfitobacter mediterraneus]
MPTPFEDQFFKVDPGSPPPVGTQLVFQRVEFIDENDDGNIGTNTGDTFNGVNVTNVWENDTLTVELPSGAQVTYTGVTFYLASGSPVFTPTDGQVLQNGTFVSSTYVTESTQTPVGSFGPTCFTPGTMINTPTGARLIEDLRIGDLVETLDHGPQPIRYIVDGRFRAAGDFAPIRFEAGSIGNDQPLEVSPQHRMLISGWKAELFYEQASVLVAAKHLVNGHSVRQVFGGPVRYLHLLFDQHEIVFGQGVPSESYFPGHACDALESATNHELLSFFPELLDYADTTQTTARSIVRGKEAALLVN